MMRATLVVGMLWATSASADPGFSRDALLPLVDAPAPLALRPKSDHRIDMLAAATEHRHDRLWGAIDVTALVASIAGLACDWGQTHRMAANGWQPFYNRRLMTNWIPNEDNPILGHAPSAGAVNTYFAVAAVANIAIWLVTPRKYRSIAPAALIAFQANAIVGNVTNTDSVCGL